MALLDGKDRLSLLLLIASVTLSFAFVIVVPSFARAHPTSTSSSTSCKQQGEDSIIVMAKPTASGIPRWYQHEISVTAPNRGCHLITHQITAAIKSDITSINIGMVNIFIQHTSASLTINENTDLDVLRDMEVALNELVPGTWTADGTFHHTAEGEDDMPGHVKSSLMGTSLNIPIRNGHMALGTWQGIYLNEHRNQGGWGGGHTRKIIITLQGQS